MTLQIDLIGYLSGVMALVGQGVQDRPVPNAPASRIRMAADVADGRATARYHMSRNDMDQLVAYLSMLKQNRVPERSSAQRLASPTVTLVSTDRPAAMPSGSPKPLKSDAQYWVERGALASAYGAERAAITYFEKALALDPSRIHLYFNIGVSYGELGEYDNAIDALNKAIAADPSQGVYLYARGRVHLLAADNDRAMEDFYRAAELGSADASDYLARIVDGPEP
jgi:tetratricopeptide (TPR) repeat protein